MKKLFFKIKCWYKRYMERKEIIYSDFYDNELRKGDFIE